MWESNKQQQNSSHRTKMSGNSRARSVCLHGDMHCWQGQKKQKVVSQVRRGTQQAPAHASKS